MSKLLIYILATSIIALLYFITLIIIKKSNTKSKSSISMILIIVILFSFFLIIFGIDFVDLYYSSKVGYKFYSHSDLIYISMLWGLMVTIIVLEIITLFYKFFQKNL